MARMNWDKVRKENLVRSQGALRVPPEQAWTKPKRKKRKKKTLNARPAIMQRPLKEGPNCHAMVKETRFERHVREACPRRRGEVKCAPAAAHPTQPAPIYARIVGPAEKYVTCRDCAVEVLASRLSRHQAAHKVLRPIVSERQASRQGVRSVTCSRCGELVRVDLLKQHVARHVPVSSRAMRDRATLARYRGV